MVVSQANGAARFDMQTVINRAGVTLRAHGPALVLGALLIIGATAFASRFLLNAFLAEMTAADRAGLPWRVFAATELDAVFGGITSALLTAWVTVVLVADQTGSSQTHPLAALGVVFRRALPIAVLSVLLLLATLFGFILLVVPGVMVMLGYMLATPVQVAEGLSPVRSLSRSWRLTRGYRGGIFGLALVWFVPVMVVEFILAKLFGGGASFVQSLDTPAMSLVVLPIFTALADLAFAAGIASAYVELVGLKDGGLTASIGEVFA